MSFGLMTIFFFVVLLLTLALLSIMNVARVEKGIDFGNKAGLAVSLAIFLGWILVQVSSSADLIKGASFVFGMAPFGLAALALSLYAVNKSPFNRFWIILAVTALSVLFLPENLMMFQGYLPFWLDRCAMAIAWAVFVNAYTTMDKIDNFTFIQTSAISVALLFVPMLIVSSDRVQPFDFTFAAYPFLILGGLIGFATYKKWTPSLTMGKCGAIPLGYLMGLFLVLLTCKGWICAFIIMPAYYYFEIIYSRIYRLFHRDNPEPKVFTFFISKVIRENLTNRRIMPFVFFVMIVLALMGVVFKPDVQFGLMLALCWLLVSIIRLSRWKYGRVTYKAIFANTRDAGVEAWKNSKQAVGEVISAFKKKK